MLIDPKRYERKTRYGENLTKHRTEMIRKMTNAVTVHIGTTRMMYATEYIDATDRLPQVELPKTSLVLRAV